MGGIKKLTIKYIHGKGLIKRFHTLLGKYKVSNEAKEALLAGFGVESSTELNVMQLVELCETVEKQFTPGSDELDKLRKRLMASIYGWRKALGCVTTATEVKAIACRAAGIPDGYSVDIRYNSIPKEKLNSLYHAFCKKTKDLSIVSDMTNELTDKLTILN